MCACLLIALHFTQLGNRRITKVADFGINSWSISANSLTPLAANPSANNDQNMILAHRCAGSGYLSHGFGISSRSLVLGYGLRIDAADSDERFRRNIPRRSRPSSLALPTESPEKWSCREESKIEREDLTGVLDRIELEEKDENW